MEGALSVAGLTNGLAVQAPSGLAVQENGNAPPSWSAQRLKVLPAEPCGA